MRRLLVLLGVSGVAGLAVVAVVAVVVNRVGVSGAAGRLLVPVAAIAMLGAVGLTWTVLLVAYGRHGAAESGPRTERGTVADGLNADVFAQLSLWMLWGRQRWIVRRVEHMALRDAHMVRRRVSIDFLVPPDAVEPYVTASGEIGDTSLDEVAAKARRELEQAETSVPRYVPISVLRAWPPVLNFDLVGEDGVSRSLLSKAATHALDAALLQRAADYALGQVGRELSSLLERIVYEHGIPSRQALDGVRTAVRTARETFEGELDPERVEWFLRLAELFVDSTLLWVEAPATAGQRVIVKLAYDEPIRRRLTLIGGILSGFGLRPAVVAIQVGQLGDAGSCHFELEVPAPLEIVRAELVVSRERPGVASGPLGRFVRRSVARRREAWSRWIRAAGAVLGQGPAGDEVPERVFVQHYTRRAHFYASERASRPATALVELAVSRRSLPLRSLVVSLAVAVATTGALLLVPSLVAAEPGSSVIGACVAILLLGPGLMNHLLMGGDEHEYAAGILTGVRLLGVASVALGVAAGACVVTGLLLGDHGLLEKLLQGATIAAWAIVAVLTLSLVLPPRRASVRSD